MGFVDGGAKVCQWGGAKMGPFDMRAMKRAALSYSKHTPRGIDRRQVNSVGLFGEWRDGCAFG